MNSSAQDIAYLLGQDSSLALTPGTDLFRSRIPASPQNCVTIIDRAGDPSLLTLQKSTSAYYYCGIVAYIRNIDYDAGYAQALAINQFLHGTANTVINGTFYSLIYAIGEPRLLHWDGNDRAMFIVNFNIQRRNNN